MARAFEEPGREDGKAPASVAFVWKIRMIDAVGGVAKVVGVALKIKEAADTVRQNKKDCHHIKSRIEILNKTLSQHGNNMELMEDSAVMAALEALDKILGEALEVIIECQEERNIICVYYTSGKLSRQLSKVEQRISHLNSDVMLTIMSYQLPRKYQDGVPPLHSQVHSSIRTPFHSQAMQPPSLPQKMTKQYQDEADKQVRIQTSQRDGLLPRFIEWKGAGDLSFKHMLQSAQAYEVAPPVTIDSEWDDPPVRVDSAWDSSINFFPRARAYEAARPVTIDSELDASPARVDSQWDSSINFFPRAHAYEAARPVTIDSELDASPARVDSQWDSSIVALGCCCNMARKRTPQKLVPQPSSAPGLDGGRTGQPRSLLQQIAEVARNIKELENTAMAEEPAMRDALKKLLVTFCEAHKLVTACQRRGLIIMCASSSPGKLSKQLHEVLDQMVSNINQMIAVVVNSTLHPQRHRRATEVRGQSQATTSSQQGS
ncbi:uncharacterized protein LOC100829235 isoform X3 [Brachypodium distachyon]|uniref:Mixed lineage kinase domain-containing protein n=2 Tax=Brachypodium distachyon TaxID=15368 RepID=A0A2K2CLW0_BRADI|nr:uncharacterized protein LOC100829235 isoform X3 [Brachypodium distachyon]PNT63011.1 hypothetical protein BRADI_4g10431v3 [Brachypodium distachyon]|eukprot:XP_010237429.1 uncharacterized protein LOC100829235 isoform X3 [Brachypodium distachyon]